MIAFGSHGMAVSNSDGQQASILIGLDSLQTANSSFSLINAQGEQLIDIKPTKAYSSVFLTLPTLQLNTSYHYFLNGMKSGSFELKEMVMKLGKSGPFIGGGPRGMRPF